jgi:enoyl-CoA hydratase
MSDPVRVERNGPVTTVIIDRPEARNAVNGPTATGLFEAFEEFDRDDAASVAVLWGDHGTFCAGADLKAFGTTAANAVHRTGPGPMGPTRMMLSKPVIAGVSGYAVAGGLELALWCDLRVASETAVFGVFCRRWGVPLVDGGTVRLPRTIGQGPALDMILTGRPVGADEALRLGLANRVVAAGKARDAAVALATDLAALPQTCLRSDRASVYAQWDLPLAEALRTEAELGMATLREPGAMDGAARFAAGAGRHGTPAT